MRRHLPVRDGLVGRHSGRGGRSSNLPTPTNGLFLTEDRPVFASAVTVRNRSPLEPPLWNTLWNTS
jgi:hypothetical protein